MSRAVRNGLRQEDSVYNGLAEGDDDSGVSDVHKPVTSEPLRSMTGKNALKYKRLKLRSCVRSTCEDVPRLDYRSKSM